MGVDLDGCQVFGGGDVMNSSREVAQRASRRVACHVSSDGGEHDADESGAYEDDP